MTKQKQETEEIKKTETADVSAASQPEEIPVPDKFKDKTGTVNVEALLKSYLALEKKLGDSRANSTLQGTYPEKPEDYQIEIRNKFFVNDPEINQRFFDLKLTNEQAQGIYDLAAEKIIPVIEELVETFQTNQDLADLEQTFGGSEQFNTVARQISQWGEKNLDPAVFNALVGTKNGIMTLYKMMCSTQENPVLPRSENTSQEITEEGLKRLMQDPKYWKKQDPEYLKRVADGFKRLYGSSAI